MDFYLQYRSKVGCICRGGKFIFDGQKDVVAWLFYIFCKDVKQENIDRCRFKFAFSFKFKNTFSITFVSHLSLWNKDEKLKEMVLCEAKNRSENKWIFQRFFWALFPFNARVSLHFAHFHGFPLSSLGVTLSFESIIFESPIGYNLPMGLNILYHTVRA